MGRARVVVAVLAGLVGVSAIVLGVRISMRDSRATLATENTVIPDADDPDESDSHGNDAVTDTTFDLGVLAPRTTDAASPSMATSTTAPVVTTTTVPKGYARVRVTNSSALATRVVLTDRSEYAKVIPAGDSVDWAVRTADGFDSGSAYVNGTSCGPAWSGADHLVAGREYHLEVKPSVGYCANGQPMPMVLLTDYTVGGSKMFTGLVPDAERALVYIRNQYGAAVRVRLNDVDEIEWTIDPTVWGAPQLLATASDHGDGASVARVDDPTCGFGDGENYFLAGHSYRIDVVDGSGSCGAAKAPALRIFDLTTNTSVLLG